MSSWLDELTARPMPEVVKALGLETRGRHAWPCPACNATTRKTYDPRPGALHFGPRSWACQQCHEKGGAVRLAALALIGRVPAKGDRDGWRALREAAAGVGLCGPYEGAARPIRRPRPAPHPKSDPVQRPPDRLAEVRALWARAAMPGLVQPYLDYGRRRGLDRAEILRLGGLGMIGWLPGGGALPWWARRPIERGYRCLVPCVDARGDLVEVRFRWPWPGDPPDGRSKSECAPGSSGLHAGTVIAADPVMRAILRAGPAARPGTLEGEHGALDWSSGRIHLVEGEGDAWAMAADLYARGLCPARGWAAVGAYGSGTFSEEIARRLPSRATVIVHPDPDNGGVKVAAPIIRALQARGLSVEVDAAALGRRAA